jgi:PD-(D/E)XK nuclease superfamily protein
MNSLPVLNYSALNAYQVCPRRFAHMYVFKDLPRETKSKEQLDGTAAHEALKRRIRLNEPLPAEYATYEPIAKTIFDSDKIKYTELKLGIDVTGLACDFFADDVWLRGALDLVLSSGEEALLLDWKTGKTREDPFELEIQGLLLQAKWPSFRRITGHYVWLRDLTIGAAHDCSNTANTLATIKRTEERLRHRAAGEDWPPDEGPLCGWCPVTKEMCEFKRNQK